MRFINKYLRNLSPYKVASHKIWEVSSDERKKMLKLDWNEATIPPSPLVNERLNKIVNQQEVYYLYPSTHNAELLGLLSTYTSLPEENIQYFASSDSHNDGWQREVIFYRNAVRFCRRSKTPGNCGVGAHAAAV